MNLPRIAVESRPLWQFVRDALEESILRHELAPGMRLNEMVLARQLGVSRSPVREALRSLEQEGWVVLRPRFGVSVRTPNPGEADQLFDVRGVLESHAASSAVAQTDPSGLEKMESVVRQGKRAVEMGDVQALVALNSEFHAVLRNAAANQILADVLDRLDKLVRWYFASVASPRAFASWQEHEEILHAVRDYDAARVGHLVTLHNKRTRRALREANPDILGPSDKGSTSGTRDSDQGVSGGR